jgi:hypothetical protein
LRRDGAERYREPEWRRRADRAAPHRGRVPQPRLPDGDHPVLRQSTATLSAGAAAGADTRVAAAPPTATPLPEASPNGFAIDLGTATNVNTLRAHWGSVKTAHAALLDGLRPLVSVRTSARPGFTEFHLVAGPIADADVATRLCAALTSVRVPCRPATFDGQRLDLR